MESIYTALSIIGGVTFIAIRCLIIKRKEQKENETTIHQQTDLIRDCIFSCYCYNDILICEDMIKERLDPKDPDYKDCIRVLNQCLMIQKAKLACKSQERVIKQLASQIHYFKTFS